MCFVVEPLKRGCAWQNMDVAPSEMPSNGQSSICQQAHTNAPASQGRRIARPPSYSAAPISTSGTRRTSASAMPSWMASAERRSSEVSIPPFEREKDGYLFKPSHPPPVLALQKLLPESPEHSPVILCESCADEYSLESLNLEAIPVRWLTFAPLLAAVGCRCFVDIYQKPTFVLHSHCSECKFSIINFYRLIIHPAHRRSLSAPCATAMGYVMPQRTRHQCRPE